MRSDELNGKVAVVTGVSRKRGLGRAIAACLAAAGADVVACAAPGGEARLTEEERESGWKGLQSVVGEIRANGRRAIGLEVDVRVAEDVQRMVQEAITALGRIDILVNNAAFPRSNDRVELVKLPVELWRGVIDVNLNGTMLCCKFVAERLIAQGEGGRIVNISSIAAMQGQATFSAYAASKAGVHALNGVLAAELGPYGITSNVVSPGFLDTARVDVLRQGDRWHKRLSSIPLGRPGSPDEVAEVVRFLCGPGGGYVNGEVIVVDGGEIRRTSR